MRTKNSKKLPVVRWDPAHPSVLVDQERPKQKNTCLVVQCFAVFNSSSVIHTELDKKLFLLLNISTPLRFEIVYYDIMAIDPTSPF